MSESVTIEPIRVHVVASDIAPPAPPVVPYRERVAAPSSFTFAAGDPEIMLAGKSANRCRLTVTCSGGAALLCATRGDAQARRGAKITDTMVLHLTTTTELWGIGFDAAATPTLGLVPEYESAPP